MYVYTPTLTELTGVGKRLFLNELAGVVALLDGQGENQVKLDQQGLEWLGQLLRCVRNEQLTRTLQVSVHFLQKEMWRGRETKGQRKQTKERKER